MYPEVANPEQVSDWERLFYTVLFDHGIQTIPQYPVDKYKLDLAIIDGERKLDIEIDGEMYHKDWNGELSYRDQLRNQRLFELGWDVKRFLVYQIRDNLQECIEYIQKWKSIKE
jgi:very-short-patch-repair endonuclease